MGGLGGAVLLVPALVLVGVEPAQAASMGLLSVAAGSLAAAAGHIDAGVVNHRLAISVELPASLGAILGSLLAGILSADILEAVLAAAAVIAAAATFIGRDPVANEYPAFAAEACGEWPGVLGGAYSEDGEVVPYMARNVRGSLGLMSVAGLVAGMSGTSGGYIKTPVMNRMMGIPVKVAAATSTMTVGVTAATALIVRMGQHSLDLGLGASIILGSVIGGRVGTAVSQRIPTRMIRNLLTVVLVVAAVVVVLK